MNILVTGAKGFIGKNLTAQLHNIIEGKAQVPTLSSRMRLFEYDLDTEPALLDDYCKRADFVFHLAGVNRPQEQAEFMEGNFGFTSVLLDTLRKCGNACPVLLASSIQAEADHPYGRSKKAGEELLFSYGAETGARILVYRFPNVFGKWCRPNYNSVVATFCHNIARGLLVTVNDRNAVLTFAYIDDLVDEMLRALSGEETRAGRYCTVPVTHQVTLGRLADLLHGFAACREDRDVPDLSDAFVKKLYATYQSYLPGDRFGYPLKMNRDARGSFTELFRTADRGQYSINITRPGIVKGNHWHHTKHEKFIVVSGRGIIRLRRMDDDEVISYVVSGEQIEAVDIPPGYTHTIENVGETDLVTFMWCSECFDPEHPDTYYLEV